MFACFKFDDFPPFAVRYFEKPVEKDSFPDAAKTCDYHRLLGSTSGEPTQQNFERSCLIIAPYENFGGRACVRRIWIVDVVHVPSLGIFGAFSSFS